jgi:cytochrome c-type biogenesis protein
MAIASFVALFGAGVLTFASPCVLPLLPMYLAVLEGPRAGSDEGAARRRLRWAGLGFALGLGLVFVVLGMGASAVASTISHHRRTAEVAAGVLMLLFGAKLLGLVRLPWLEREARPLLSRVPGMGGFGGGALLGSAFAIGWTPCVGPVLGAALTYAATSTANPLVAGAMLAAYALGLAAPLVAASFAASHLLVLTRRLRAYTPVTQKAAGLLMVAMGLHLASDRWSMFAPSASTTPTCSFSTTACAAAPTEPPRLTAKMDQLPQGPALVEFVSAYCTVCKRMHPIVSELEQRCAEGLVTRVSVDDKDGRSLADHYGVKLLPTFVTIDASGSEVHRIVGEQTRQQLMLALSEIRGAPCDARL